MPQRNRSKRAAARQTQLGQRKKRQSRGSSAAARRPHQTDAAPATGANAVSEPERRPEPAAQRAAPATPAAPPSRPAEPRPAIYGYVKSEVKRIGVLAAGVLVILIALSFVLR